MNALQPVEPPKSSLTAKPLTPVAEKTVNLWQQCIDAIAVILAGTCAVHCLLLPVFVITFPLLGSSFVNDPRFHFWMLAAVIPTTAIAIFLGCRKHKDKLVIGLSILGLSALTAGVFMEMQLHHNHSDHHHEHSHGHASLHSTPLNLPTQSWLSIFGGLLMTTAHIRNFKNCRTKNSDCHCKH